MIHRTLYGIYDDETTLLSGVKEMRSRGVVISEVYTPFAVHGLDKILGVKPTRMGIVSFICGITGLSLAILMTWYMMVEDWPVNIGGKPNFSYHENMASFIPVIFEGTVFCAAHGMVIIFLWRSRLIPGKRRRNPIAETTSHHFAVEVETSGNTIEANEIRNMFRTTGVIDIQEKY